MRKQLKSKEFVYNAFLFSPKSNILETRTTYSSQTDAFSLLRNQSKPFFIDNVSNNCSEGVVSYTRIVRLNELTIKQQCIRELDKSNYFHPPSIARNSCVIAYIFSDVFGL